MRRSLCPMPLLILLAPLPGMAQATCDGKLVSAVIIQRSERTVMDKLRAPAWSRAILQPVLLGIPTKSHAIRPFLQLREGMPCTEQRRAESERVLRLQPYLADATVRVVDEADGRVRVEVETIDDARPIVGVGVRDSRPSFVELGNSNIAGTGHLASVSWRGGRAFRDGIGVRYADYHLFDRPMVANVLLARRPLGGFTQVAVAQPFYTDLQEVAGYAGYVRDDGYLQFVRPSGDPLALNTVRERADIGVAMRLATASSARVLVGALASVERRRAAITPVIISDTGLVPQPSDRALVAQYVSSDAVQLGVVSGVRVINFAKVKGFDALEGVQDIGRGVQLATTIGTTVSGSSTGPFAAGDFYAGVGSERSFLGVRSQFESRRRDARWANIVGSGRVAWYSRPSPRQTRLWSIEYAGAWRHDVPYQLTIDDPLSGVRGYAGSRVAGGSRLIVRAERRIVFPGVARYLGWGAAAFADAGHMFKGDVPFGSSSTRGSVGLSVLTAVPRESRSLARLDFAFPYVPDRGAKDFSVRFTYTIAGRSFWREPFQIARARLATSASNIFTWP